VSAPEPIVLDLPSEAPVLSVVRAAFRALADDKRVRLLPREVDEVQVVLQEACTNVIRHAHKGDASKRLVVEILRHDDALEIVVRDRGAPFQLKERRDDETGEIPEGGYGVTIMRSWMDEVALTHDGTGNVLRMVRRYKAPVGDERVAAR
jgi:serine/threonine-protein kinase RsbW